MLARIRRLPWRVRYRLVPRVASRGRQLALRATHLHAHVSFGPYNRIGPGFTLEIPGTGTFRSGTAVDFRRDFVCEVAGDGVVDIGDLCVFTYGAVIQCSTSVKIGRGCQFGQALLIVDGNHNYKDPDKPMQQQGFDFRPITIGDGATILTKCTILADIGERAMIAANSVVTRPIPAYCLAAGSPARVIEYFGPPELRPADLVVRKST